MKSIKSVGFVLVFLLLFSYFCSAFGRQPDTEQKGKLKTVEDIADADQGEKIHLLVECGGIPSSGYFIAPGTKNGFDIFLDIGSILHLKVDNTWRTISCGQTDNVSGIRLGLGDRELVPIGVSNSTMPIHLQAACTEYPLNVADTSLADAYVVKIVVPLGSKALAAGKKREFFNCNGDFFGADTEAANLRKEVKPKVVEDIADATYIAIINVWVECGIPNSGYIIPTTKSNSFRIYLGLGSIIQFQEAKGWRTISCDQNDKVSNIHLGQGEYKVEPIHRSIGNRPIHLAAACSESPYSVATSRFDDAEVVRITVPPGSKALAVGKKSKLFNCSGNSFKADTELGNLQSGSRSSTRHSPGKTKLRQKQALEIVDDDQIRNVLSDASAATGTPPKEPKDQTSTSCPANFSHLAAQMPRFRDAKLSDIRQSILDTDMADIVAKSKQQGQSKSQTINMALRQAQEFDSSARQNAKAASGVSSYLTPQAILAAADSGSLSLSLSCESSMVEAAECAVIQQVWGAMANREIAKQLEVCW